MRELSLWLAFSIVLHVGLLVGLGRSELKTDSYIYHYVGKSFAESGEFLSPSDVWKFELEKDTDLVEIEEPLHDAGVLYPLFIGSVYYLFGSGVVFTGVDCA